MNRIMLPVGMSSFTEICRNNYYYIDKTGLIQELLEKDFSSVTLITRPRRFGKTLAMKLCDLLLLPDACASRKKAFLQEPTIL